MSFYEKMSKINDNIRYRTGKTGLLGLDAMASEIKDINWVEDPFHQKAEEVNSTSQMTDKTKLYILKSTGTFYAYKSGSSTTTTIKEDIVGTPDNPWGAGRLSSGNPNGISGYVTTPYIDLQKYSVPFTLHLKGITFSYTSFGSAVQGNIRYSQYDTSKAHLKTDMTQATSFHTYWNNAVMTDVGDGTVEIAFTPPVTNKSVNVGYARFSGYGAEANANVYITYQETSSTESGWIDTGISASLASDSPLPTDYELSIVNQSVRAFMNSAEYDSNNYGYTQVTEYAVSDGSRKDLPKPIELSWSGDLGKLYAVSINSQIYYTGDESITISNLIPNTKYHYSVYALLDGGKMKLIQQGDFSTTEDKTRMLYIEGIQNVRDIGGYTGLNGKKVKYGLIYRGSGLDEADKENHYVTDAGKNEMLSRLHIGTDLDLRGSANGTNISSALGSSVDFYTPTYSYLNYAMAITRADARAQFRDMFEYIISQLVKGKNIYVHCSGGCDRTGTLVFLLLGLLGVSESDLAKEYELSCFSEVGKGRYRTTNDPNGYDYKGMVEAIKAYSGSSIYDKFKSFAVDCDISIDNVSKYQSLMLK